MLWVCEFEHKWKACLNSIINCKSGCPECGGFVKKDLDYCNKIAKEKGGLLSTKYVSNKKNLQWQCSNGHVFNTCLNKVTYRGQWCPDCSVNRIKRTCLERYGVPNVMQFHEIASKSSKNAAKGFLIHWSTDEQLYYQSSWEKKAIEHLNKNQIDFDWQPKTFRLDKLNCSYRPDLYLSGEDVYVEIKGFFREKSKKKWENFKKLYPKSQLWDKAVLKNMGIL